ncbi:MAG TPA: YkvA family protein [Candidatus Limnocylindrales bacterium]|nr:YkvA family protein [Candidatus Limnocylindrales bacterium]
MDTVVAALGGLILALVAVWLLLILVLWLIRPRDVRAVEIVRLVPDLLRLVRDLLLDRTAPRGVRVALGILLVWLINPIDLIPEFIPVLGPLDDVIVAVVVLRYVRRRLGAEELRARWRGSPEGWALVERLLAGR